MSTANVPYQGLSRRQHCCVRILRVTMSLGAARQRFRHAHVSRELTLAMTTNAHCAVVGPVVLCRADTRTD